MNDKDPGPRPAGYGWTPSNCHNFATWQEEIDHAAAEGFELVPHDEDLRYGGLYYTLRKDGFDTTRVGGNPAGRYGYPIYQRVIKNPDELRFNRFPVLEHPNVGDCLRADVGITPSVQRIYRMLWWNDTAQAYVGDGKWIVDNESCQPHQFQWDHKLEKDTGHRLRVEKVERQPDSVKYARGMQFAMDAEKINAVINLPPSKWYAKGVWYHRRDMADLDQPVDSAYVTIEGRAYELTRIREGNNEVWDIKDRGLTPVGVQEQLLDALRFYGSGQADEGAKARDTLEQLGFKLSV